ncbi:MAG: hypothetical protein JSR33_13200 [Proteobacteria bacterium]|nr:hypothetical protein [Pseudomonadota bacterium]
MIKKIKIASTAITVLTVSSFAYGADIDPSVKENHSVVNAIHELENKIEAITTSTVNTVNLQAYKLDQSYPLSMALNMKQEDVQADSRKETQRASNQAIKMNLQPFSAYALTYTNKSQPEVVKVTKEMNNYQDSINRLKNLEASDTLYSLVQGMETSTYWTRNNIGKPGRNDDAFNFGAFIEPDAYTPEQMVNSQNFIGYATKQYQSLSDGIDFNSLHNALLQYQKQGVKTLSQQIDLFRNNTAYKNYQLTVRSMTAANSVATDVLSGLASERKPIIKAEADPQLDAISRLIGVEPRVINSKDDKGQTITLYSYASPMQIANFRANYRLNSSQWYQEVATDSSENLQRKTVILLAEIASKLQDMQKLQEKTAATLAIMSLQSNDMNTTILKTKVDEVNTAINKFAEAASASNQAQNAQTNSTSNSSNNSTADPNNYNTQDAENGVNNGSISTDPNTYNQTGN